MVMADFHLPYCLGIYLERPKTKTIKTSDMIV